MAPLPDGALDQIFRKARTHSAWLDKPVSDAQLREIRELLKWGPTSANCSPGRIVFVRSREAKQMLEPALSEGNREKTMAAPATAIIAYDLEFYDKLPRLFPHTDARSWFAGNPELIRTMAFRNGTLQRAYLIIAARALGLDCGPMSGFENAIVDAAFFPDGKWKSNFLCNLGYGDPAKLKPPSPRLSFEDACRVREGADADLRRASQGLVPFQTSRAERMGRCITPVPALLPRQAELPPAGTRQVGTALVDALVSA